MGNDAVVAEAQFGLFEDNAGFAPTPEGIAPKVRMGLITRDTASRTDDLDSDYDGSVVFHEYGHGVAIVWLELKQYELSHEIQSGALGEDGQTTFHKLLQ